MENFYNKHIVKVEVEHRRILHGKSVNYNQKMKMRAPLPENDDELGQAIQQYKQKKLTTFEMIKHRHQLEK